MKRWIQRAIVSACFLGTPAFAAELEWWAVDQSLIAELESKDVGTLSKELAAAKPADARAAARAFDVAVRAGHAEHVRSAIDRLAEFKDVEPGELTHLAMFLIEREEWALARHFVERFPQTSPGWAYVMVRQWSKDGAGHDEIDRWLAARAEANDFWLTERVRFRADQKTVGPLLDEMRKAVEEKPDDTRRIGAYIRAAADAGDVAAQHLAGLKDVVKPPTAYETHQVADRLANYRPADALALFQRSLEMKFTKADEEAIEKMRSMRQSAIRQPGPADHERELRLATKREMMQLHQKLGNAAEAQRLLVELADAEKDGIPRGMLFQAGQIQAASGQRVIQGRIEDAPPENQDTADYWLGRAQYFAGRKEKDQAKAAFEKALELATRDDQRRGKDSRTFKSDVLDRYATWLARAESPKASYGMVWAALKDEPLDGAVVGRALQQMWWLPDDIAKRALLTPADERVWRVLAAREQWDHAEQRLVVHLLGFAEQRAAVIEQLETLAREKHPTRAAALGWALTRADHRNADLKHRAIPWIADAAARLEDPQKKLSTQFNLFETRLSLGQWKEALDLWPVAKNQLTARERTSWLSQIAVAAAKAGQKERAMEIWSRCANMDRTDLRRLDEMASAGLADELAGFYDAMAKADPATTAPARARRMLGR